MSVKLTKQVNKYQEDKKDWEEKKGDGDKGGELTKPYGKWNLMATSRYRYQKDTKNRGSPTKAAEKEWEHKGDVEGKAHQEIIEIIRENEIT